VKHYCARARREPFNVASTCADRGELSDYAVLILAGTVKILISAVDGSQTLLGLCGSGELVGELAAIAQNGMPRSASVITATAGTCRVMSSPVFRQLLNDRPAMQQAITLLCADRMRQAAMDKLQATAYPATARVAWLLLSLAERHVSIHGGVSS
jgi:CRP-like cAMP-binding protein